jgi:tyrosinase
MLLRTGVKLLLVSPAPSFSVSFSTDRPPDPVNSPMFDGSAYSMSGNGIYEAHNCTNALPTGLNCIPPGVGGGCVKTGPFQKCVFISDLSACTNKPDSMSVNLGPVSPTLAEPEVMNSASWPGSAYNPRCLKRDVSVWVSSQVRSKP